MSGSFLSSCSLQMKSCLLISVVTVRMRAPKTSRASGRRIQGFRIAGTSCARRNKQQCDYRESNANDDLRGCTKLLRQAYASADRRSAQIVIFRVANEDAVLASCHQEKRRQRMLGPAAMSHIGHGNSISDSAQVISTASLLRQLVIILAVSIA